MNRVVIVAGIVVAATAFAAPEKRVTFGDWVGVYQGKLAWYQCTTAGEKQATLVLEATDGVMAIDLSPAHAGVKTLSLVQDDKGWSGQQGDAKVAITRPKANAIAIELHLESGCMMKAQLVRSGGNVAACDQLVGWARVESKCAKRDSRLEDFAKLAATKWKPADAARCTTRSEKLELALVDAGCAPHPDPTIGVRARDCLELTQAAAKLSRCGNLPADIRDRIKLEAQALSSAAQSAERATLPYVERQCRDAKANIVAIATQFHCD